MKLTLNDTNKTEVKVGSFYLIEYVFENNIHFLKCYRFSFNGKPLALEYDSREIALDDLDKYSKAYEKNTKE